MKIKIRDIYIVIFSPSKLREVFEKKLVKSNSEILFKSISQKKTRNYPHNTDQKKIVKSYNSIQPFENQVHQLYLH